MTIEIRSAEAGDKAAWLPLWQAYLAFYNVTLDPAVTASTWARITDPSERLSMRLAFVDGRLGGFAIHHQHDSTWAIAPECYLEDLFVDGEMRGHGIGRALIDDLLEIVRTRGWSGLYWHTDEGNARARALYDQYVKSDGHIRYRMKV